MEIRFENKEQSVWREAFRQSKRSRESLESVVPDVSEDIGRVASVQSRVLLKSKDMTERGAELTGELIVSLLYITEGEDAAASLQLSKDFRMEFELPEHGAEAFPAAELTVLSAEARVLNPRKVAVTVELGGELRVYQQEKCTVASYLPEGDWPGLYCRVEQAEATLQNIEVSLDETEIRAPFDGVITQKYIEEGSMISNGTPLVAVQDPQDNWVDIKVPETELSKYAVGQQVKLIGRDGKTEVTGTITDISKKAEFATQRATSERGDETDIVSFNVKVQVDSDVLRPGMRFRLAGDAS